MIRCRERVEYTDAKLEGAPCETSKIRAVAILEICVCAFQTKDFVVVTNIMANGTTAAQMAKPTVPIAEPPKKDDEAEVCPSGGYTYIVKAGDTLANIAAAYQAQVPGITWQHIAQYNNLYSPYLLQIGQVLRIPCVVGKG